MTNTVPMIRFEKVVKRFDQNVVLDDFDFEVYPGEKVALIGPSGSGKSTVLRILMTLEPIQSGMVWVDGDLLWHQKRGDTLLPASNAHLRTMRTKLGMVFQQFNLFPHMTVLRNLIEAPMAVQKMSRKAATERAHELLKLVGLSDKVKSYPAQLSGGQQQRVAIARALALRPKILLFDEPTSALDPELVGEVLNVIRGLAHEHDLTMLLVTHEMRFAEEIADRVCFFDKGKIVEACEPKQMFSNPQHERTRQFLNAVLKKQSLEEPHAPMN
jgi:polar amino acid transport system ATP-binding protein